MAKIKGIDVSHHQGKIDWVKVVTDFVFIKATQGVNFIDPMFKLNQETARWRGLLCGFYHFADGGDARKEARHFLNTVGGINEGELLALDWKINHKDPTGWCLEFLREVENKVGFKPLLYTNEARVKSIDWSEVVKNSNGLWVAKYNTNDGKMGKEPTSGKWPFWAIWQYTSRGKMTGISGNVDMNVSNMGYHTLTLYGKPSSGQEPLVDAYSKYLPNEDQRCNCVKYARRYVPKLPYGLWTLSDKKSIINTMEPKPGEVAVINAGSWGHVAIVTNICNNGMVTIKEANFKTCRITERRNYPEKLKIIGYFKSQ